MMSGRTKDAHRGSPAVSGGAKTGTAVLVLALVIGSAAAWLWWNGRDRGAGGEARSPAVRPEDKSGARQTGGEDDRVRLLRGRWVRPDGGYILEIRGTDPDGRADVFYFNPRPINVSRAEISRVGGEIRLLVELRDEGYPGSTYTLLYDPASDVLKGVYHQAALGRSYDIFFVRVEGAAGQ